MWVNVSELLVSLRIAHSAMAHNMFDGERFFLAVRTFVYTSSLHEMSMCQSGVTDSQSAQYYFRFSVFWKVRRAPWSDSIFNTSEFICCGGILPVT